MRAAAGLHLADLARTSQIADVEDAYAAEPVNADVLADALQSAVNAPTGLLDRHDQQIADDRHVTLPARADDGAVQLGDALVVELVDIETVIAAGDHLVVREGHVGIRETQQRRALTPFGVLVVLVIGVRVRILIGVGIRLRRRQASGIVGIEETGRLRQCGDELHIHDRLAGVHEAGR